MARKIRVPGHAKSLGHVDRALHDQLSERVFRDVRMGKDLRAVDHQQLRRRGAIASQLAVGERGAHIETSALTLQAHRPEEPQRVRVRVVAPAIFFKVVDVPVVAPAAAVAAMLNRGATPRKRAAIPFRRGAIEGESILHLQRERAAEAVEPEYGIRSGQQLHALHGRQRNEIPAHRVAKGLIHAHRRSGTRRVPAADRAAAKP